MTPEQIKGLFHFAKDIMQEGWEDGGCDVSYDTLIDLGRKHGILVQQTATKANQSRWEDIEYVDEGDRFYTLAPWMATSS